jgi:hypothetical protein
LIANLVASVASQVTITFNASFVSSAVTVTSQPVVEASSAITDLVTVQTIEVVLVSFLFIEPVIVQVLALNVLLNAAQVSLKLTKELA